MAGVGFRWLDILEKEFDKAFVDLDVTIGDLESDEPDVVYNVRQKMSTLSSCFAQLVHKSQTIFQNSAKIEAELIHMRAELVESKCKREILEQELHTVVVQLHAAQLASSTNTTDPKLQPEAHIIRKKLQEELQRRGNITNGDVNVPAKLRAHVDQLQNENTALRRSVLSLGSEVYGARLAAKYLDKELAGRIQQLQLLGRDMRGEVRDRLWRQLESEILLQRHKTVVRACRRNNMLSTPCKPCPRPESSQIRTVIVKRNSGQGLGVSVTGGREHGVPILVSELELNGPAERTKEIFVGDAILAVNGVDLRHVCHRDAVEVLQRQQGDCRLELQYVAADENSGDELSDDGYHFQFFEAEAGMNGNEVGGGALVNTPTAPRTPDSQNSHSR